MTWQWDIDPETGDLLCWDHTQDPSTDSPAATRSPPAGQSGWSWSGEFPRTTLDIMHSEAKAAIASNDVERAIAVTLDMAGEQIERYDSGGNSGDK